MLYFLILPVVLVLGIAYFLWEVTHAREVGEHYED